MDSIDPAAFDETLANARRALLAARSAKGYWEGELSSSALSTATAVFVLSLHPKWRDDPLVARGLDWLKSTQNPDGGWGDTIKSLSNISTTALCWAAFAAGVVVQASKPARAGLEACTTSEAYGETIARAEAWLTEKAGGAHPDHLIPAIIKRYGKDHTFSVPILTMCALAGRLGDGRAAWKRIPQLPFELAAFPQRWFKWLRLPVVSYALPALIAIGLVRHRHRPTRNPLTLAGRHLARTRALRLLENIQPSSGGYLEATPLTSFVVMSLIGAGLADHPVVHRGIEFLVRSARPDGSWAIDTNLATWVTTLAVNALAIDPDFHQILPEPERLKIRDWLLDQQYTAEHPYTLANPGGWAWTDLPGGVPDADDTPGALLALKNLGLIDSRTTRAAALGIRWLLRLQNLDHGVPTFCRGWGKLPFDRSAADLTAHALRAWGAWFDRLNPRFQKRVERAVLGAGHFFTFRTDRHDGAWIPLWFGNQHAPDDENPTYGTARVLLAATDKRVPYAYVRPSIERGATWLLKSQGDQGGWGPGRNTPASTEETALAIEALASARNYLDAALHTLSSNCPFDVTDLDCAIARGVAWLIEHTARGTRFDPSPIGFYFAKLWYFEKLYPLIFTVAALNAVQGSMAKDQNKTAKTRRREDPKALL